MPFLKTMNASLRYKTTLQLPFVIVWLALASLLLCLAPLCNAHHHTLLTATTHIQQNIHNHQRYDLLSKINNFPRGGGLLAGYNPFGYKITTLGEDFLKFDGSRDSDIGCLLSTLRARKRVASIKEQWLEIMRVSKSGQNMRIYRQLQALLDFCLQAGLID